MDTQVVITREARKGMEKAPAHVRHKLGQWIASVEMDGLEAVRRIGGYHDEPLSGQRKGQRSVRLNKAWRAIYTENAKHGVVVTLLEVTPHDYRTR